MTIEQPEQQKRWQQRHDAEEESFSRKINGFLRFWQTCPDKSCRRAQACCGEASLCFLRNWRPLPEADKVWIRAFLGAYFDGHPPAELADIADAALARFAAFRAESAPSDPASKPAARVYP